MPHRVSSNRRVGARDPTIAAHSMLATRPRTDWRRGASRHRASSPEGAHHQTVATLPVATAPRERPRRAAAAATTVSTTAASVMPAPAQIGEV